MSCRLVLFLIAILSFSALAETTIKIPLMQEPILKITSTDERVTYIDEAIDMPWRSQEHLSYLGVPHDQDYSLTVYDNSGKMSVWRIDAEQDIVLEFAPGESPKHFTYLPILMGGTVNVIDVETDEVIYTTKTQNDGSWQFEYTGDISDLPEYVLIDMVGGLAMGKPRDPTNKMMAYVQSSDLYAGSITTSIYTTASYMSIAEDKEHLIAEEFMEYYLLNNKMLTATGLKINSAPEKALYLREVGAAVGNQYLHPASEFTSPSFTEDGNSMWDAMSFMREEEQRDAFAYYFAQINGWGHAPEKRTINIQFLVVGDGNILIDGVPIKLTEIENGSGVFQSDVHIFDRYGIPLIEALPVDYASELKYWEGCVDEFADICAPSDDVGSVIVATFGSKTFKNENVYIYDRSGDHWLFSDDRVYFSPDTDSSVAKIELTYLSPGSETGAAHYLTLDQKSWFKILEKHTPSIDQENDISQYYLVGEWTTQDPRGQNLSKQIFKVTNKDKWVQLMGNNVPYQPGYIVGITPEDGGSPRRGFYASPDSSSTELVFYDELNFTANSLSLMRAASNTDICNEFKYTNDKNFGVITIDGSVSVRACAPSKQENEEIVTRQDLPFGRGLIKNRKTFNQSLTIEGVGSVVLQNSVGISPYAKGTIEGFITLGVKGEVVSHYIEDQDGDLLNIPWISIEKSDFTPDLSSLSGATSIEAGVGAQIRLNSKYGIGGNLGFQVKGVVKLINFSSLQDYQLCDTETPTIDVTAYAVGGMFFKNGSRTYEPKALRPLKDTTSYELPGLAYNPGVSVQDCLNPKVEISDVSNGIVYTVGNDQPTSATITLSNPSHIDAKFTFVKRSQNQGLVTMNKEAFVPAGESVSISIIGNPEIMKTAKPMEHKVIVEAYVEFGDGMGAYGRKSLGNVSIPVQINVKNAPNAFTFYDGANIRYQGNGRFLFLGGYKTNHYSSDLELKKVYATRFSEKLGTPVSPSEVEIALVNKDNQILATKTYSYFRYSDRIIQTEYFKLIMYMPSLGEFLELPSYQGKTNVNLWSRVPTSRQSYYSLIQECSCTNTNRATGEVSQEAFTEIFTQRTHDNQVVFKERHCGLIARAGGSMYVRHIKYNGVDYVGGAGGMLAGRTLIVSDESYNSDTRQACTNKQTVRNVANQ